MSNISGQGWEPTRRVDQGWTGDTYKRSYYFDTELIMVVKSFVVQAPAGESHSIGPA